VEKGKFTIGLGIRSHALEYSNGDKYWYLNDKLHREDGPAIEAANGTKYWYINGKPLSCTTQKQFEQLMRLKAFW
jgi:hypothetical protein